MIYQRVNFFLWVLKSQQPLTLCMESLQGIPRMTIVRRRGWPEWPGWALNASEVIGVPNSCFFLMEDPIKNRMIWGYPMPLDTSIYGFYVCYVCIMAYFMASLPWTWHNTKDQHKHRKHQYLYLAFGNPNHVEIRDGTRLDIKSIAITAAASKIIDQTFQFLQNLTWNMMCDHFSKEMHRDV